MISSSLLTHPLLFSLDQRQKNKYLSSRRLYKVQAKISGHAEDILVRGSRETIIIKTNIGNEIKQ